MSHFSRRAALLLSLLLLTSLTVYHLGAQAQDKKAQTKNEKGKKVDAKDKKGEKKEGKKEEKKEVKKEEYRPDVALFDLKGDKSGDWVEALQYGPDGKTLGARIAIIASCASGNRRRRKKS